MGFKMPASCAWILTLVLFAVVAAQVVLLAIPRARRTRVGAWAENLLKRTPFYFGAKRLYWSGTIGVLRRWTGRSRVCSLRDVFNYSRYHKQRTRHVNAVKANARLEQRDPAGYEMWSTPEGPWWIPAGESPALFELLAEQQSGIYDNAASAVRAGDVVLDCGANVGCYARHALRSGARLVVVVEPAFDDVECLQRNLADAITMGSVIVCAKGVWRRDEWLALSGSGVGRRVIEGSADDTAAALRVALTTIDKLVDELRLETVDFIKMDIEGAEVPALVGAQNTLLKYRPRLAIAGYHNREDSETIPAAVLKARPDYHFEFGPFYNPGWVRPQTLFFY